MSGTVAIVVFFTGLLFIILIHEAGHYLVARAYGFKVEEYFVGFGPKIWSFTAQRHRVRREGAAARRLREDRRHEPVRARRHPRICTGATAPNPSGSARW